MRFVFGASTIDVGPHRTYTEFPDGTCAVAVHAIQKGQTAMARELGYKTAVHMNRHHDLTHMMLSHWLGLPFSLTLKGVADGHEWPQWRDEEAAVLAVQKFANSAGIDLLKVAKKHSNLVPSPNVGGEDAYSAQHTGPLPNPSLSHDTRPPTDRRKIAVSCSPGDDRAFRGRDETARG
jgi:hypothetical protein